VRLSIDLNSLSTYVFFTPLRAAREYPTLNPSPEGRETLNSMQLT
jgi:hypothetical protein